MFGLACGRGARYLAEEAIGKPVTILFPSERHDEEVAIMANVSGAVIASIIMKPFADAMTAA
jgi:hypothetical protein